MRLSTFFALTVFALPLVPLSARAQEAAAAVAPVKASTPVPVAQPAAVPLVTPPCTAKTMIDDNYTKIKKLCNEATDDELMREQVSALTETFIDFKEFGELSLGKYWAGLTEAQHVEFLDEFKKMLKKTYLRRFKRGQDFSFGYRSDCRFNTEGDRLEVQTSLKTGETEVDVDYRFHGKDGKWLVYDLVVDEVSVMRNYRTSFVKVLKNEGYAALIDKMRKKNIEVDDGKDEI